MASRHWAASLSSLQPTGAHCVVVCVGGRERQTDRQRERHRETQRDTERQRHRDTERHRETQRDRDCCDRDTDSTALLCTSKTRHARLCVSPRGANGQSHLRSPAGEHSLPGNRGKDAHAEKQTNKHTHIHTHARTHAHTHTHTLSLSLSLSLSRPRPLSSGPSGSCCDPAGVHTSHTAGR